MKYNLIISIFVMVLFTACHNHFIKDNVGGFTNEQNEIKPSISFNHIKHIRDNSNRGGIDGEVYKPEFFVDYVIENLLESPEHKKYITDRKLLRKLDNKICWDNYALISDTLMNGDKCRIKIITQDFIPENHILKYEEESEFLIEIDGKYPFGAGYSKYPTKELKSLEIIVNDKILNTRLEEYNNLYEPDFCNFGRHRRITEAYEDGGNIYIYIFGGNAAGSYFAKLIFDESGFVTSIVADYVPLSMYGSFGEHFIGF